MWLGLVWCGCSIWFGLGWLWVEFSLARTLKAAENSGYLVVHPQVQFLVWVWSEVALLCFGLVWLGFARRERDNMWLWLVLVLVYVVGANIY